VGRLGVSRTVVREALNVLEARGVLSIEHGRGAVVSRDGMQAVRETLALLLRVEPATMRELLEMRAIFEVEVAGLAAERKTTEDVALMRVELERMGRSIETPEGYVDADVEFHALLARATGNGVLLMMMDPVLYLLRASRRISASRPGNARRALHEHEKILSCVERGDAEGARRRMREHIQATEWDVMQALGEERLDARPPSRLLEDKGGV
jgi:GntR family transcriptional repressor for pyruvate dehydrogenase complex